MATHGGPNYNIGETYKQFTERVNSQGGNIVNISPNELQQGVGLLSQDPSILMVPIASDTPSLPSIVPTDGTGDFTVSRNGTATYFDKDGLLKVAGVNEPRLEFDPLTGEFKGVLVEPAATNYFTDNTYSNVDGSIIDETTFTRKPSQGIFGLDSIEGVVQDTYVSGQIELRYTINLPAGFYTHSFYVRKNCDFLRIEHLFNVAPNQTQFLFNATTGDIDASSGITNYGVEDFGDWWKVYYTIESTGGNILFDYEPSRFIGATYEFCGSQIEAGYVPTSFIPTSGSQVTRPSETITRTNVQDIIGQTEGSIYVEFLMINQPSNARVAFAIQFGSTNILGIGAKDGRVALILRILNGSLFTSTLGPVFNNGELVKVLLKYEANSRKIFINGSLESTSTSSNPTNFTAYTLSGDNLFFSSLMTTRKTAALFKHALTDEQAIALTTL